MNRVHDKNQKQTGSHFVIWKAVNGNFALASSRFQEEIIAMLGHRATPGRTGRPRKGGEEGKD